MSHKEERNISHYFVIFESREIEYEQQYRIQEIFYAGDFQITKTVVNLYYEI